MVSPLGLHDRFTPKEHKLTPRKPRRKTGKRTLGSGRAKGTRNKVFKELRELAGDYTLQSLERLWELAKQSKDRQVALLACRELLDRAHGKVAPAMPALPSSNRTGLNVMIVQYGQDIPPEPEPFASVDHGLARSRPPEGQAYGVDHGQNHGHMRAPALVAPPPVEDISPSDD